MNPAAGGGRSRKLLGPALERLRAGGIEIEVAETQGAGDATELRATPTGAGHRKFIAVGGDGTSYEIVNGLFPEASAGERADAGISAAGHGQFFSARFQRSRRGACDRIADSQAERRPAMCCACGIATA